MKKLLCIAFLVIGNHTYAQDTRSICMKINELNNSILEGRIKKQAAIAPFKTLIASLQQTINFPKMDSWIFPLLGYRAAAIGGVKGNGYNDKGYNYFDGNKHTAHPAHDIFISDSNQDGMDDKTHSPVNVLSVAAGVVIACSNEWDEHSNLRGGKYIWIYHPQFNTISYYAHNRAIFVSPGDEVEQGQRIAEVGRTGFNAFKKRSPTHLHFGAYQLQNGLPIPFNCYLNLLKAQTK
jgi:hypothetical protein